MEIVRITVRLKQSEDAVLLDAIEAMPTGERNRTLKKALEESLIHGPTLAQALDRLAGTLEKLEPHGASPASREAAKSKPDKAALKAALLGPFQAQ